MFQDSRVFIFKDTKIWLKDPLSGLTQFLATDLAIFSHVGKRLDKKAKVNSKFITSSTGKLIISIDPMSIYAIYPNITKCKSN